MSGAQKFVFATDFSGGAQRGPSEADLAAARADGFRAGADQARREADAALASSLQRLVRQAEALLAVQASGLAAIEAEAAEACVAIARRLARAALEAQPLADLEAAARACLSHARSAPHLAVRVHPDQVEKVEAMLARLGRETGFGGKVVVLGEPEIMPGDGRLEWADGGMRLDRAGLERMVDRAVEALFRADGG